MTPAPAAGPLDALARRFLRTAELEFAGASPLYERLARGVAGDRELLALAALAPPERQPNLLLFAAVHYLLLGGARGPLAAYYPSLAAGPAPDDDPWTAFRAFCVEHHDELAAILRARLVQTNEPRRCVGWLPALGLVSRLAGGRPLALVEVGASVGLNLLPDRYAYDYGDGRRVGAQASPVTLTTALRGARRPPLPADPLPIASRVGLDLNPLDLRDPDSARWLRACLWPEGRGRATILDAALAVAAADPPAVRRGDALADLPALLATIPRDLPVCLYHSATLAYLAPADRAAFVALIADLAAGRELYWLSSEGPGLGLRAVAARAAGRHEAAHWIVLTTFGARGARERLLARIAGHGDWLEWLDEGA